MILPTTNINFGSLADQATSTFFNNPGTTLKDEVIKIAKQNNLNPEEIKRLVEHTNISTTKKVLASVKDRRAEFEVVDSKEVLASTHEISSTQPEDSMNKEASLVQDFSELVTAREKSFKKTSSILEQYKERFKKQASSEGTSTDKAILNTFFSLKKEKSELELKKMASEILVKDTIDFLISEFSKYYPPDFNKFASESYTLFGNSVVPILNSIKDYLSPRQRVTDTNSYSFDKVAYVIDDSDKLLKKMAVLKDAMIDLVAVNKRLFEVNSRIPK